MVLEYLDPDLQYFQRIPDSNVISRFEQKINQDAGRLCDYIAHVASLPIFQGLNIRQFPCLGSLAIGVSADADMVIDDKIIDIKCTNNNDGYCPITNFYQLLGYASLYYIKHEIKLNTLVSVNLIQNNILTWDISGWTNDELRSFANIFR